MSAACGTYTSPQHLNIEGRRPDRSSFVNKMVIQSVRLHKADNRRDTARTSIGKRPGRSFARNRRAILDYRWFFAFFIFKLIAILRTAPSVGSTSNTASVLYCAVSTRYLNTLYH